jgi:hypothetical protein
VTLPRCFVAHARRVPNPVVSDFTEPRATTSGGGDRGPADEITYTRQTDSLAKLQPMVPTLPLKVPPQRYRGSGFPPYVRRLLKWRQMDLEYTAWQAWLMCVNPRLVYRHTTYRKQTKNRWARDDPAFVVLTGLLVCFVTLLYCAFYSHALAQTGYVTLCAVLVDYVTLGALVATANWFLANRFLRARSANHSHAVEQRVEWLFAFDIHVNAFFPTCITLYLVQLVLSPLLLTTGLLPRIASCALYCGSLCYYHYCTFLGYAALPFLDRTTVFLYPAYLTTALTPIAIFAGFNPTRFVLSIYFHDILG